MILNGKAKEDFEKWYFENHFSSNIKFEDLLPHYIYDVFGWLYKQSLTIQNALIIKFFDSIENIIQIHNVCDDWWFRVKSKTKTIKSEKYNEYKNRQQATIQAIEKANDLYNSRYENV